MHTLNRSHYETEKAIKILFKLSYNRKLVRRVATFSAFQRFYPKGFLDIKQTFDVVELEEENLPKVCIVKIFQTKVACFDR